MRLTARNLLLRLSLVLLLVSCDSAADFEGRAREVAARWQGSADDRAWRTGFVPLGVLNPYGWITGRLPYWAARSAHNKAWRLAVTLPAQVPSPAPVRWPDGSVSHVPLVSAAAAYAEVTGGSHLIEDPCPAKGCRRLVFTGVTLGAVPMETSRGTIQAPVWRFTAEGLDQPFFRVAVDPSAVTPRPRRAQGDLERVMAFELVPGRPKDLLVRYGHGACETVEKVLVHETDQVVVVGVTASPTGAGACPAILKTATATVTLGRPLGDRLVLDSGGGLPVLPGVKR
ncbi:hypothetical protein [Herbidospora cretacea]|uniref:hypothetical protein n=1 Tax=Herbidospora cretacea TaxID=28444 RepID=UPI0004C2D131|nr:hypothetical protein [Herbidospora cretacea]